jgi:hypothetical protein
MDWAVEKTSDTIAQFVVHRGVKLESRYRKLAEFMVMVAMVERCGDFRDEIARIYCDTQVQHRYWVILRAVCPNSHLPDFVEWIAGRCSDAAVAAHGYHNGLSVALEGDNGLWGGRVLWDVDPDGLADPADNGRQ